MNGSLSDVELFCVRIPMRMRFRRVTWREAVLLRGPQGWGEFSPFADYPPEVTNRWLAAALEAACAPSPAPVRERVMVNTTVPAVDPVRAAELVRASGCATAKVKVAEPGIPFEDDIERVAAVRSALGPGGRLRIDVNAGWTLDEAVERLGALVEFGLEYVEQPVASIEDLIALRARLDVRIAVDEAVRLAADPLAVAASGAADVLVLKVQPMGGVERVLDLARRSSLPIVISSALETSVGLATGLVAAAALEDLPYACGLGTGTLLAGDVVDDPLVPVGGSLTVRRPHPSDALLDRWKADPTTERRLLRRLRQSAEFLT